MQWLRLCGQYVDCCRVGNILIVGEPTIFMTDAMDTNSLPRYRWVSLMDIEPGMVTARPILAGAEKQGVILIAVGSTVTANTIAQLFNKGIECIAVEVDSTDSGDEADCTAQVQKYQDRLIEIFGESPDENCRPLLEALIRMGPSRQ